MLIITAKIAHELSSVVSAFTGNGLFLGHLQKHVDMTTSLFSLYLLAEYTTSPVVCTLLHSIIPYFGKGGNAADSFNLCGRKRQRVECLTAP